MPCLELTSVYFLSKSKLFLEREAAAILAEAKTDDLISEAPKPALDQSGEWQETSGEIQWVAAENNDSQTENKEGEKKEEEDEELDLNKGRQASGAVFSFGWNHNLNGCGSCCWSDYCQVQKLLGFWIIKAAYNIFTLETSASKQCWWESVML